MFKMGKLLVSAVGAAAAMMGSTGALAESKGSLYGDFRYGLSYFNDDAGIAAEDDMGDLGSFFGIKASTQVEGITAFGTYTRVLDTDDCVSIVSGLGSSTTSVCAGSTDYVREGYAGVATPFGTVTYGQQETLYAQAARRYDPFYNAGVAGVLGTGFFPGVGGAHGGSLLATPLFGFAFVDNQLNYVSPSFFGVNMNVAYFSNEDSGGTEDPDFGIGASYGIFGIKAEVQHLRIRSGFVGTPNFAVGGGGQFDATVLSVGFAQDAWGVGVTAERLDDRAGGSLDADTLQASGWVGLFGNLRIAAAYGQSNEYVTEGRSGTVGVFYDVVENFTAHLAGSRLEGDAGFGTPDGEVITLGASYKFDLGFATR